MSFFDRVKASGAGLLIFVFAGQALAQQSSASQLLDQGTARVLRSLDDGGS
jgi:hypothetical protein